MEMNEKTREGTQKKVRNRDRTGTKPRSWNIGRTELDTIYKKKYESLASLQVDMKNLMDRMNNRVHNAPPPGQGRRLVFLLKIGPPVCLSG